MDYDYKNKDSDKIQEETRKIKLDFINSQLEVDGVLHLGDIPIISSWVWHPDSMLGELLNPIKSPQPSLSETTKLYGASLSKNN